MKIETLSAPAKADSFQQTPTQKAARERAVAAFNAAGKPPQAQPAAASLPQDTPVQNPSQIAPEEMSAIAPQPPEIKEEIPSQEAKSDNIEQSPPKEATKDEAPLSAQYAQLARKEKALQARMQDFKRQQAAFKAAQDASKPVASPATSEQPDLSGYISKDQLKSNLWQTLGEMGITYDEVTQQALNAPSQTDVALQQLQAKYDKEIKAIRDEQEQFKKASAEQQTQAYQDAINQIRNEAKRLVDSDDSYEAIKASGSVDDVVELIEQTWKADKIVMSVEEAAQEVENYLVDEYLKLANLKKIQSRLKTSAAPTIPQKQPTDQPKQPQQAKTLTNGMGSTRPLTAKERAVLAFKGQLKK